MEEFWTQIKFMIVYKLSLFSISEWYGFLVELVEILVVDVSILELLDLCFLNVLYLISFVVDSLSDFSAFFQVVESILLFDLVVSWNLTSDFMWVID